MFSSVSNMIRKYGYEIDIITEGNTVTSKAFIEPLHYKNRIHIGGSYHYVGGYESKYLYIGLLEVALVENKTIIHFNNRYYRVVRVEKYKNEGKFLYTWAILVLIEKNNKTGLLRGEKWTK